MALWYSNVCVRECVCKVWHTANSYDMEYCVLSMIILQQDSV